MIRAYLVDDEPLALKRLARMLEETGRVQIAGSCSDPVAARPALAKLAVDVLFLDIEMPGMTGFELLGSLESQPLVVFTTAYDRYALRAFEVNSIDYLLKPIEKPQLDRALAKLERIGKGAEPRPDLQAALDQIATALQQKASQRLDRIASRTGEKVQFIELRKITHFFAEDKLTYAATASKNYVVDHTIADLEQRLDERKFIRIHRSTILNLDYLLELDTWFGGRMLARLKDPKSTELQVARDRARPLRERLGL
ncbi:MAG: LytR/AlgR family response regulator transcription factor [Bryobacteraceae bacterium]